MAKVPPKTLIALKSIGLAGFLSATDKRVAGALLEHFNHDHFRCDPSHQRLADLLKVARRTVIRSTNKLQRVGLFRSVRHGGARNCNSYEPVWAKFDALELEWRERFRREKKARKMAKLSLSQRQECHMFGDESVTQIFLMNHSNKPKGASGFENNEIDTPPKQPQTRIRQMTQ